MSLIDSTAAFKAHCDKIDDAGNLWNLVRSNGLRSMSQLAFAIGTPQSPPTEQEFKDFCRNINEGVDLSLGLFAQMRRLHFEASTMIVAHLRSQVSQESGQEGVRKLPNAEKVARLERQQARLNGVSIKGELQPSHALIDLVASMCDTNSVIWVAPSKCSKREREVQQLTKEKTPVLTVEQRMLKFSGPEEEISVDTSTELHWQWAMQRRGIALDQCGLIHWDTHQKWLQQLLGLVSRDPPEGYSRVRLEQLVKADQELFTIMAEELQHTSVTLTSVPAPMDDAMTRLSHDPRVQMFLLPLARGGKTPASSGGASSSGAGNPPNRHPVQRPTKLKKPSAKAKSICPVELQGYSSRDSEGNAVCFGYNLKAGCKLEVTNGRCKKGMHKCIKCGRANHGLSTCRASN